VDHLTTLVQNLYVTTGLIGLILAMALESCCIPIPSEVVMPLAGAMLTVGNKHMLGINPASPLWLNLVLLGLAGAFGCLLGSIVAYGIGAAGGRPLMLKYGKYVLISQRDAERADRFFQRWGAATAFFSRLLPAVRTYISLPAGISKMPFGTFCVYTFLGSFPWCLLLSYLGYLLGNHYDQISGPFRYLEGIVGIGLVVLLVLYIWNHIRDQRRARAAEHSAITSASQQEIGNL
jgi:membrane protein DedA with SNARE-associated domain